jgi:hypothetical protein
MPGDPADSRDLRVVAAPPTAGKPKRVFDVLLAARTGGPVEDFEAHPPVGDPPVDLGAGLRIEALNATLSDLVLEACSLRGHYFRPARQFGFRYAYVLDQPLTEAHRFRWDHDIVLRRAVILSRLVRENTDSTEYAARVTEYADGDLRVMPFDGDESRYIFRLSKGRDWLDAADAEALRSLLDAYVGARPLPDRVRRALWRSEHLAQERWLDVRLPGMVVTLDGLVATSRRQVVRQFVERVPALASELGIPHVTKSFCRKMYAARSQGAHGVEIDLVQVEADQRSAVEKTGRLQTVLRAGFRRAIEDVAFREIFADDDSIRRQWPVRIRPRWRPLRNELL